MNKITVRNYLIISLLMAAFSLQAQEYIPPEKLDDDQKEYMEQVPDLVSYLEGTLNFLGDKTADFEEKEVIHKESYLKMFENDKVQIEDDLDENRDVIINKDVQAYLKDVDFFFKWAVFEFTVDSIKYFHIKGGFDYIQVIVTRNLKAETVKNKSINNNKVRFLEININQRNKEMKIASIYSTKLTDEEELRAWWANLSDEWKQVFYRKEEVKDTITYTQLKKIRDLKRLDISKNEQVLDIEPLIRLVNLNYINISNTLVDDLRPIRNLPKLNTLIFTNTGVASLEAIHNLTEIKELNCSDTQVKDLSPLKSLKKLEILHCADNLITDLEVLNSLPKLRILDCHSNPIKSLLPLRAAFDLEKLSCYNTEIQDIKPLENLRNLKELSCFSTPIKSLEPLKELVKLEKLKCYNTEITSLDHLEKLVNLKEVYFDNTEISAQTSKVDAFKASHPKCLVVYKSEELMKWWLKLSPTWQAVFQRYVKTDKTPSDPQLHKIAGIRTIDISKNLNIKNLEPLKQLNDLSDLQFSETNVADLSPLQNLKNMQILKFSKTSVANLLPIKNLSNLQIIDCDRTKVADITPLINLKKLKKLYCEYAHVDIGKIAGFYNKNPQVLIIYQTNELKIWWRTLPRSWKKLFGEHLKIDAVPTREQLHLIVNLTEIKIINNHKIKDLKPLIRLKRLQELQIEDTPINSLEPLRSFHNLEVLACAKNPITDLQPIAGLKKLRVLNFSNTQVESFENLVNLTNLEELYCSGTEVNGLKYLVKLKKLNTLECYNTRIKYLKYLYGLKNLRLLKCYNTKTSEKRVAEFKKKNRKCEVVFYGGKSGFKFW